MVAQNGAIAEPALERRIPSCVASTRNDEFGLDLVGDCCGTDVEHIAAIACDSRLMTKRD